MKELQIALAECNRVLKVFWSITPLSETHYRYLYWKYELERRIILADKLRG